MNPLLSILIPTLPSRTLDIHYLLGKLNSQIMEFGYKDLIEIIYLGDNKRMPVGKKRNILKKLASGKFVTYVDDDDIISANYLKFIIEAIKLKPRVGVITYHVWITINDGVKKPVVYSAGFQRDKNLVDRYERIPNHLMVWSKRLINKEHFKNINFGEDAEWSKRMKKHIKSSYAIDSFLYHYKSDHIKSETLPDAIRKQLLKTKTKKS